MYRARHAYTRQLIAGLLMAVMLLVHVSKALHSHATSNSDHLCKQENVVGKAGPVHGACNICEFQLAKDASFSSDVLLAIAPVYAAPTYSSLLTAINPDRLFITEGRGPPQA
jgi:hypothetical protein